VPATLADKESTRMKKMLAPFTLSTLLLTGWAIQQLGSTNAMAKIEGRHAVTAEDYSNDAAQRLKQGIPRHWSAMVLRR
jgi:hypothetical protein